MQCIHSDFCLAIRMKGFTFLTATAVISGKYKPLLSSFNIFQIISLLQTIAVFPNIVSAETIPF